MVVDGVASVRNCNEAQYPIVYVHRGIRFEVHSTNTYWLELICDLYFAFILETRLNEGYNNHQCLDWSVEVKFIVGK